MGDHEFAEDAAYSVLNAYFKTHDKDNLLKYADLYAKHETLKTRDSLDNTMGTGLKRDLMVPVI